MRKFRDGDDRHRAVAREGLPRREGPDRRAARSTASSRAADSSPRRPACAGRQQHPRAEGERGLAFDAATCIGCGACVAACPNASASLFTAAKVGHLAEMPQGQPERWTRVLAMTEQMDAEGFGGCTFHGECEAACPKAISVRFISKMNFDYLRARLMHGRRVPQGSDGAGG
jgi:succinate dehydrogenase/fumarate reductase-like Fe-S protein